MSIATMRNRVSTEFRKVERDSDEYLELQAQRDPNDGYPVWEETSLTDAVEQSKRLDSGAPLATDIGDAQQPVGRITGAAEPHVPASQVRDPLPSEREAGVEPEESVLGSLPPFESSREEVPQTAAMESPTDTDVSGTEPDLKEAREQSESGSSSGPTSAGRKASSRSKKSDSTQPSEQKSE